MSKKSKEKRRNDNDQRKNNNDWKDSNIPSAVKEFAELDWDNYKKKNKEYFDSKKEMRIDYFNSLIFSLPDMIDFILRKGHQQVSGIQKAKNLCFMKFSGKDSEKFVEYLTSMIDEDGTDCIENIKLLPIILHEIIGMIFMYNKDHADDPSALIAPPDDLFKLSETILKKRLKKAEKLGMSSNLAFDALSIIPVKAAMEYSPYFRIRTLFDVLYRYAESEILDFDAIIKFLIKESDYPYVIGFALQERKDKSKYFNDKQRKLFDDINTWIFEQLESMSIDDIDDVLKNYIKSRERDALQGKDSPRRYYLGSLPSSIYPNICKAISRIKSRTPEHEKYL